MKRKHKIFKAVFLVSSILFIAFPFEFFIRQEYFLGGVILLTGIVNLLSYQKASHRVKHINIALIAFNSILSYFISDSYALINYNTLYFAWLAFSLLFLLVLVFQVIYRIKHNRMKKKIREHFNS